MQKQVIQSPERRYDCTMAVDLAPWHPPAGTNAEAMFTATVHCEYRTTSPRTPMRFSSVSDQGTYQELLHDPTTALVWRFRPTGDLHGGSDEAFELAEFTVDGKPLRIRRTKQARGQTFVVNLPANVEPEETGTPVSSPHGVRIAYTYRLLVRQAGHLLYLDIGSLTKGLTIAFRYGGCSIQAVNTLPFIASAEPTRLMQTPPESPTPRVEIGFDGGVLQRSGVAFVDARG